MPGGKPVKPPTSGRQQRAMFAAASGNSTLGIPQSVGREKAKAAMKKAHGGNFTAKDRGELNRLGRPGTMESIRGRAKASAERSGQGVRAGGKRF